jgi:hypothetical protein
MPLPAPVARLELHLRTIDLRGFHRDDGLYDIEASLVDVKAEDYTVDSGRIIRRGESLHDMAIRLVVDDDLNVKEVFAATDAAPYPICPAAAGTLLCLVGLRIGPGWSRAVRERLAGRQGCTHLTELLKPLATVAIQTLSGLRKSRPDQANGAGKPAKIDSCYAYSAERELIRQRWPAYYLGAGKD